VSALLADWLEYLLDQKRWLIVTDAVGQVSFRRPAGHEYLSGVASLKTAHELAPKPCRAIRAAQAVSLAMSLAVAACGQRQAPAYQGYAEGEFVLVAAPSAGRLEKRFVQRGDAVEAGSALFVIEQENEKAARNEAQGRMDNAKARLDNLSLARRAPELEALRAQQLQAVAARTLSAAQLRQQEKLYADKFISQAGLDAARAAYARDTARLAEIDAQLRNGSLAIGREQEIGAARADLDAAVLFLHSRTGAWPSAPCVHPPRQRCRTRFIRKANGCKPAARWSACWRRMP
jgi:biotin carboxyl carrier protein